MMLNCWSLYDLFVTETATTEPKSRRKCIGTTVSQWPEPTCNLSTVLSARLPSKPPQTCG
eukprot:5557967-Amphidinium_carterae.1